MPATKDYTDFSIECSALFSVFFRVDVTPTFGSDFINVAVVATPSGKKHQSEIAATNA